MLRRVEALIDFPEPASSMTVILSEAVSGDPIPEVFVLMDGFPLNDVRSTDFDGRCEFRGRLSGRHAFWAFEKECHLDLDRLESSADAVSGEVILRASVHRTLATVVMVRHHMRIGDRRLSESDEVVPGINRQALLNNPGKLAGHPVDPGHWWTVVHQSPYSADPPRSYGWWPMAPVDGFTQLVAGVEGVLNGPHATKPEPERHMDPHHDDPPAQQDEFFMPFARSGNTPPAIRGEIHHFATSFSGEWSYRFGMPSVNCHEFQRRMMRHAQLEKPGLPRVVHRVRAGKPPKLTI